MFHVTIMFVVCVKSSIVANPWWTFATTEERLWNKKFTKKPPKMHEIQLQNNQNAGKGLMYLVGESLARNGRPQVTELSSQNCAGM